MATRPPVFTAGRQPVIPAPAVPRMVAPAAPAVPARAVMPRNPAIPANPEIQPAVMPAVPEMRTMAIPAAPTLAPPSGAGGGAQPAPTELDPNGLVPVNRVQPMANDGYAAQRMLENRLGTMPPTSFSGAGAGFVPLNRPDNGSYRQALGDWRGDRREVFSDWRGAVREAQQAGTAIPERPTWDTPRPVRADFATTPVAPGVPATPVATRPVVVRPQIGATTQELANLSPEAEERRRIMMERFGPQFAGVRAGLLGGA